MSTEFVIDASFAHASITPAAMRRIGATGAILYAGCNDNGKNVTKREMHALLDDGFHVGLVIENSERDLLGGKGTGQRFGRAVIAAAKSLGYDYENCAIYTSADWNSRGADIDKIDAALAGFGQEVPHPGIYGNSYAMDRCRSTGSARFFWQSDSQSFSDYRYYPHAHLWQLYNDHRAGGLTVDVNNINSTPLGLMGENMALTDADATLMWHHPVIGANFKADAATWLRQAHDSSAAAATSAKAAASSAAAISAVVNSLPARVADTEAQLTAIQAQLAGMTQQLASLSAAGQEALDANAVAQLVIGALQSGAFKLQIGGV